MNEPPSVTRTNPSAAKHLPPGKVLAGRFRLDQIVGVGGMGVVYAAHDLELDLPVAVKVLRPEMADDELLKERFRRELILARQVSHRNVVRIHDLYQDDELRFLTMDLVTGRPLRALLREEGPLPVERVVALFLQLARALEAAHQQGVVHRDLKPANVLVEETETEQQDDAAGEVAHITDFGIARSLGVAASGLTATGTVVGSLEYLSPEQALGSDLDGRSDLYSLGLIVYEMLTGELPFERGSDVELIAQRISSSPSLVALGDIPAWLRDVIGKLLQRDPEKRYARAGDLVRDLESRTFAGSSGRSRPRIATVLVFVALTAVALTVGFWFWRAMVAPDDMVAEDPGPQAGADAEGSVAAPSHSVAVLPLALAEGRDDLAWTSRGAAESLAHGLAESRDLRVVDSFRVFRLLDDLGLRVGVEGLSDTERSNVAKLLGVDRLVFGSVQPAEGGLQLSLSLQQIEPAGGVTRLSASGAGLADVAGRLSDEIRRALRAQAPDARYADEPAPPAARDAYDRGVEALLAGDGTAAVDLLRSAVEAGPDFVAAWIRLSDAYAGQGRFDEAEAAIRRAAELAGSGGGRRSLEIAARQADLEGEPERAQELWQRLVDSYPQDVEARIHLATAHGDAGALERARQLLLEVVAVDAKHPRAWYLLSKYTIQAGDLRTAVDEYLVHALVIQNQLDNDQGRADVLNAMGVAYDRLGRIDLAEERYREAAELRRRTGDLRGYATSLRNLGALAAVRGDYEAAEERYDEAAAALEDLGDRYGLASLASRRGLLAEERGQYREALGHYRRALQMRRDLGDSRVLVESYNSVGFAYYLLGDYDNASVYWHQALDEVATGGNRQGEVFVRQSLGQLYLAQGRWADATRAFLDALEVSRELDMPDTLAVSQGYLGRLAQLQGRYAAAFESYDEALEVVRRLDDPRGLAEFGLLRAEALFELGDESAAGALGVVREALTSAENREQAALLDVLEARLALRQGETARAAEHAARAGDDARASHSVVADWRSRWVAAELDLARGRVGAAVATLEALRDEADGLGHGVLRLLVAESLGRALLATGRPEASRDAFRAGLSVLPAGLQYAHAYRLRLGLAEALRSLGDGAAANAETEQARVEIERLRRDMDPAHRASFDRLDEVARLGV